MAPTASQCIALNAHYQELLGWTNDELGLPLDATPAQAVDLIARVQRLSLHFAAAACDGVAGPSTYAAVLDLAAADVTSQIAHIVPPVMPADLSRRLRLAGKLAVLQAQRDWLGNIIDARAGSIDPASRSYIDETIRTPRGSDWSWETPYRGDGQVEWCGMAIARFYARTVPVATRRTWFPSTYRLDRFARYQDIEGAKNPLPPIGIHRMLVELDEHSTAADAKFPDGSTPRAGDIMLVGGVGTGYGKHCTLIRGPMQVLESGLAYFDTLEGNGTGKSPKGSRVQGLVRGTRPIGLARGLAPTTYFARRLIRLAPSDLVVTIV